MNSGEMTLEFTNSLKLLTHTMNYMKKVGREYVCPHELRLNVKDFDPKSFDKIAKINSEFIERKKERGIPYYRLTVPGFAFAEILREGLKII
jgi:hypothetical protein